MYTYFLYKACLSGLFIYWQIKTILRKNLCGSPYAEDTYFDSARAESERIQVK